MTTQIELKLELDAPHSNTSILQPFSNPAPSHTQGQDPADKTTQIIENILDRKIENNNKFYLVKWKSVMNSAPMWEPIENLVKCIDTVIDYEVQKRLQNPDSYYEKTSSSTVDLASTEKRNADWDLMDKILTRKQTKKEINFRHLSNKRHKLVKILGLFSETQWEDKNALDEVSKKVKMSKPFTINPIKFRFRDIMRIENGPEKKSEHTPQKVINRVRRFETEIANRSKQRRGPGRPRKIPVKLEHEETEKIDESEDAAEESLETGSERLRTMVVEIEDSSAEEEEGYQDEEEELDYNDEEEEIEYGDEEEEDEYKEEEEEKEDDSEVVPMFLRRPRGRPRKIVQNSDDPNRRRRGRPRRILTEEELAEKEKPKPKRPRGRPRRILTEEEQTENEKPKPKRPPGRPRRIKLGEGETSDPIEWNSEEEKRVLQLLTELENSPLHTTTDGSAPRKRGRPFKIVKVKNQNDQEYRKVGSEEDEIGSLEDFETIISQIRHQNSEEDNRYEEPRRKRGRPRKDLLGLGKQETQEKMDVVAQSIEEIKQEETSKLQEIAQEVKDKALGNDSQIQDVQADTEGDSQGSKLVDEAQEKGDLIMQDSGNEVKEKEKVIETKSVGKEALESKSKEGKTSAAVSILDQMQEDLMNLESPVDERAFDDCDN